MSLLIWIPVLGFAVVVLVGWGLELVNAVVAHPWAGLVWGLGAAVWVTGAVATSVWLGLDGFVAAIVALWACLALVAVVDHGWRAARSSLMTPGARRR